MHYDASLSLDSNHRRWYSKFITIAVLNSHIEFGRAKTVARNGSSQVIIIKFKASLPEGNPVRRVPK